MCGIVFALSHQPLQEDTLIRMRDRLIHRGPDGYGHQLEQAKTGHWIGLAHRRLSILDLSKNGKQPMENDDGSLIITFNGEIYNYKELKHELSMLGVSFKTETDTEVLLKAYQIWGKDAVSKLNGMFAFVIWDRSKQEIFIARDRFGEKPLYYAQLPKGGMVFASEIKAILAHPDMEGNLSEKMLGYFTSNDPMVRRSNLTFYDGVYAFGAATVMTISLDNLKQKEHCYWDPYAIKRDAGAKRNHKETVEEFRYLLDKSVKMRLNADVTLGANLSGGLDSSSICSLVGASDYHKNHAFSCFSARFDDDPTMSEGNYIDMVLDKYGFEGHMISPKEEDFLKVLDKIYWHQEQPFLSASVFLEYHLYEKIKSTGTTVILDGQGADEILAGYQHYYREFQYDYIHQKDYIRLYKNTTSFINRLKSESKKYPDSARRINTAVAHSFSHMRSDIMRSLLQPKQKRNLPDFLALQVKHDMLPEQLYSADRNSMAHSVETRFPFLDYSFVDFCLSLNTHYLFDDGWTKHILRQAMHSVLPTDICWRPDKLGFAAPQDAWLRGSLKDWAYHHIFESNNQISAEWNPDRMLSLWNKHQSGQENYAWELWKWASLSQWMDLQKETTNRPKVIND